MGGEFIVTSEGGHVFDDDENEVDLSEDWGDYDVENDIAVSISDFSSKLKLCKRYILNCHGSRMLCA
jgi:flagellar basal body rod protein FlgG